MDSLRGYAIFNRLAFTQNQDLSLTQALNQDAQCAYPDVLNRGPLPGFKPRIRTSESHDRFVFKC